MLELYIALIVLELYIALIVLELYIALIVLECLYCLYSARNIKGIILFYMFVWVIYTIIYKFIAFDTLLKCN